MIELTTTHIACRPIFDPDKHGSLYVPEIAKSRSKQGIVKYIGPDCKSKLKPGDHVLFGGYTGTLVNLEDEGLLIIMPERYITAIIHPPVTEVSGLYFQDAEGIFFPATYEMAIEIIARAIQNSDWYTAVKDGKRLYEVTGRGEVVTNEQ